MDACLIDALTGSSLRPGTVEILSTLRAKCNRLLLWSAGGADYARRRAEQHGIASFFAECLGKDRRDSEGYYEISHLGAPDSLLIFVDDQPGDIPPKARRVPVAPYLRPDDGDHALKELGAYIATDHWRTGYEAAN